MLPADLPSGLRSDQAGPVNEEKATRSAGPRNVALVGPPGSGASHLFDQITQVGDAVGTAQWNGLRATTLHRPDVVLTVVDTPGDPEFEGDLQAGLRAVDNVVFVLDATAGVDGATIELWRQCADRNLARFIVITHLDLPHADYDEMVAICQRVFGPEVVALHYPVLADDGTLGGLIDIVSMQVKDHSASAPTSRAADPEHVTLLTPARQRIGEALVNSSESPTLVRAVMEERALDNEVLATEVNRAVARGDVAPVLVAAAAPSGLGAAELVDLLLASAAAPSEFPGLLATDLNGDPIAPLDDDPNGPLAAQVIATSVHQDRGALTRVFSGTLHPGNVELVRNSELQSMTINQLTYPGSNTAQQHSMVGSLIVVHSSHGLRPGDTLTDARTPVRIDMWPVPRPQHGVQVSGASIDAVRNVLAFDPTVRVDEDRVDETTVWCMGERHAQFIESQLRTALGPQIRITSNAPRFRETITQTATAESTDPHVRLTISVSPRPLGAGVEIDGLRTSSEPMSRLDAALREGLAHGPRAGLPVIDVHLRIEPPPDSTLTITPSLPRG
jgi:elongation factor G